MSYNTGMKIALVHDYLKEYGGAERVLEALHELFPNAPVYTSVYLPSFLGPHQERFRRTRSIFCISCSFNLPERESSGPTFVGSWRNNLKLTIITS